MVVIDPAPAIRGKAMGNIEPELFDSCLNNSIPIIISIAIRKIMKEPAMAKLDTSMPNTFNNWLPIRRNARRIRKETIVTWIGLILPDLAFMSIMIGIDPGMSIMAKSTMKAARISTILKCIYYYFELN
jgi:hypothetical protein